MKVRRASLSQMLFNFRRFGFSVAPDHNRNFITFLFYNEKVEPKFNSLKTLHIP